MFSWGNNFSDMVNHFLSQLKRLIPVSVCLSGKLRYILEVYSDFFTWKNFLPVKHWQIEREGKDVTIVAYSKMVGFSLQVCHIWGVSVKDCDELLICLGMNITLKLLQYDLFSSITKL